MSKLIGNNIDYSGRCTAPVETRKEIKAYAKEKMSIVDDFLIGKRKLNREDKHTLKEHLSSLESTTAIDIYFRNFINERL